MEFVIADQFQISGRGTALYLAIDRASWDESIRDTLREVTHIAHRGTLYRIAGAEPRGPRFSGCLDGSPIDPGSYALLLDELYPKDRFPRGDSVRLVVMK